MSLRSVSQKCCSKVSLTSVEQNCRSEVSIRSVLRYVCRNVVLLRSVAQKLDFSSIAQKPLRSVDEQCGSEVLTRCSELSISSVNQKCESKVLLGKRRSEVSLRKIDHKYCLESAAQECQPEMLLSSVAQKCQFSVAQKCRSVSMGSVDQKCWLEVCVTPKCSRSSVAWKCLTKISLSSVSSRSVECG